MKSAPPRQNEEVALAALHKLEVLDSHAEAEFDALVQAASAVCGVPISLISLIDTDRQWFKANVGLPGVTQTPRELAFCAHTVLGEALFELPDACADERFFDNPLVTGEPNIRFYAGMPLRLSGGERVGTLCVIDRQPRELTALQREVLACLGVAAARALEGRHALRTVAASNAERAAEALRVRRMYESTPAMLHSVDRKGHLVAVSDQWLAKLGYTRAEVIGRPAPILLASESRGRSPQVLATLFSQGRIDDVEYQVTTRDGRVLDVLLSAVVDRGPDGQEVSLSVMQDVTQQRQTERALDMARKDLQNILDAVPSMIGYWDRHLINRVANHAYTQWFGLDATGLRGRHMRDLLGDELFERNWPHIEAALRGEAQTFERSIPRPEGLGVRHSLAHYLPDVVNGEVQGFYVLVHDVSELVEGQQKLAAAQRQSEALLRTLHQHAIVSVADRRGCITDVNDSFCAISGYTREELLGQDHRILNSGCQGRPFWIEMWRTISRGHAWRGEVCNRAKDGSLYWVNSLVAPFVGPDGHIEKYISIRNDITPIKQAQQQAEQARRDAETASKAKSQFLANMSHEIRTPMNAVIGLAYLLERTPLSAEQADTLGKIKLASQSLLGIINDVLDLSKIEASEMHIEQAPVMLGVLLDELASLARLQADAKGVGFELQQAGELPQAVLGDATRLRQVLSNLLNNAIKFTERGGVRLSVQPLQASAERVRLRFEIKDSGVGIAPEALPKLFAPFVQADTSTTRRFGGTGLGLSIVKQLVTLMGGEVGVNSTPQLGSEFWLEIDFPVCDVDTVAARAQTITTAASRGLMGVRVLITDDSPINLEVARRILELEGARVWLAGNGQQAVDHLLADPRAVDVVLMDVQMPVLDGHDATRRIRSGLGLKDLPIIALTAGITTGEHERARAAGMNDVVAKPFDPPALVSCIRKYVQVREQVTEQVPAAVEQDWPQIEGIDAQDVRRRLGGDVQLLCSMLRRLFDDFSDLGQSLQDSDAAVLARRLHTLKGSAGTLGAKSVESLAGQAEQACRAGELAQTKDLVARLAAALAQLRQASAAVLQAQTQEEPEPGPPGEMDRAALAELMEQLRGLDLAAMDSFRALGPQLRWLLGPQAFEQVRTHIDNLQFELAVAALMGVEGA